MAPKDLAVENGAVRSRRKTSRLSAKVASTMATEMVSADEVAAVVDTEAEEAMAEMVNQDVAVEDIVDAEIHKPSSNNFLAAGTDL